MLSFFYKTHEEELINEMKTFSKTCVEQLFRRNSLFAHAASGDL